MRALQARGHDVIWAKTVKQAVACYGDGTAYNAVICDYELPDATGLDFYLQALEPYLQALEPRRVRPRSDRHYTTWILWSGLDRRDEVDAHELRDVIDFVFVKDLAGQQALMTAVEES